MLLASSRYHWIEYRCNHYTSALFNIQQLNSLPLRFIGLFVSVPVQTRYLIIKVILHGPSKTYIIMKKLSPSPIKNNNDTDMDIVLKYLRYYFHHCELKSETQKDAILAIMKGKNTEWIIQFCGLFIFTYTAVLGSNVTVTCYVI